MVLFISFFLYVLVGYFSQIDGAICRITFCIYLNEDSVHSVHCVCVFDSCLQVVCINIEVAFLKVSVYLYIRVVFWD